MNSSYLDSGIVSRVFQRIGILRLIKRIFVDTSVLVRSYFAFVFPILEYCSPVLGSAAECHLQLLKRQMYSVASLCRDHSFLSLCHRRRVSRCRTSQFVRSFLPSQVRMWNDLPYTLFDTGNAGRVQGCCKPLVALLSWGLFLFG